VSKIRPSKTKDKKWAVTSPDGKIINAGARGYRIYPGTKRGDNFCARSIGQANQSKWTPGRLARHMWNCDGKKSRRGPAPKVGDEY